MKTVTTKLAFNRDAALAVLADMAETDAQWEREFALFTGRDGDVDPERYSEYDESKLDYGWELVDQLPGWVTRLTAALALVDAR